MSDVAIEVEGLSKCYRIAASRGRSSYQTLRESLTETVTARLRGIGAPRSSPPVSDTIWALDDVSFQVRQGEVLGIVGRNGAGKSTLLKILARITEPTRGRARVYGRVGALLEVGIGFHHELSGRENIYLNGAILGMRRGEIQRKLDAIIAFAEIEQFLDTPVKRYSSGMLMRLAFAVAAHLEPEILIVDEVLAVGDAVFQKKCLGKMSNVAHEGRTVLFVSHNMAAIRSLCTRALLIERGVLRRSGEVHDVTSEYLARIPDSTLEVWTPAEGVGILACEPLACNDEAQDSQTLFADRVLGFRFTVRVPGFGGARFTLGGRLTDVVGNAIGTVYSDCFGVYYSGEANQVLRVQVTNQGLRLAPGIYAFWPEMWAAGERVKSPCERVAFEVLPGDYFGFSYGGRVGEGPALWMASWSKAVASDA